MPAVGRLKLHNTGAFTARLGARWVEPDGREGHAESGTETDEGQTHSIDPGDYGCPVGASVWAYVDVVWGRDKQGSAKDGFVYARGDEHAGLYHSYGTTLDSHLRFDGVEPAE